MSINWVMLCDNGKDMPFEPLTSEKVLMVSPSVGLTLTPPLPSSDGDRDTSSTYSLQHFLAFTGHGSSFNSSVNPIINDAKGTIFLTNARVNGCRLLRLLTLFTDRIFTYLTYCCNTVLRRTNSKSV